VPSKPLSVALLLHDTAPVAVPSGALLDDTAPVAVPSDASADEVARRQRIEGWFRDHFDAVWRLAARLGVPPAQVDDVVQEAFIVADQRAAEIAAGSERGYLIGIVVRVSANQRRRQKTRADYAAGLAQEAAPGAAIDAEQLLAQKQLRQLLDVVLDELPSEQRSVLVLHELEGFSVGEIALLLELPRGTVASRLGRARSRFSKASARLRAKWSEGP
jgi:RNA polymerase sigma-70 factor (ECF subfamily)